MIVPLVLAALSPATAEAHPHPALWHWYHTSGAACVKSHEGAWTSNTGNGYYGGFQMSQWFQLTYAPRRVAVKGWANHWKPFRQVLVTRRVVRASGWGQWSTAPLCGL